MSTAMRETVSDRMVKPICWDPLRAASSGVFSRLDVTGDVFDHDDGVIHHEAGGDGQGHEGEVVEAEPQQVHRSEGPHQGERHRHARDGGRGQVAEKEEDDQHHQHHGQQQLELDVLDRLADGGGAVGHHGDLDGGGERTLQLRQERLDPVDDFDDVGARLPLDVDDHRRGVVHPGRLVDVLGTVDRLGHVREVDRRAVLVGDNQRAVILAREKLVVGADDVGLARAVKAPLGLVDVGGGEGRVQVFEGQPVGGQGRRVGVDPHCRPLTAGYADQTDPRELGDLLGKAGIGQIFHLRQRQGVGGERQRQYRRIGRVDLAVDRRIGQVAGKEGEPGVDGRLDLLLRHVKAQIETELKRDDRTAAGTGRGHLGKTGHLAELTLQGGGHGGGHDVGACPRVEGADLDGRIIDLGQGGDRQQPVGDGAGQEDGDHEQSGRHRPHDEETGNVHGVS